MRAIWLRAGGIGEGSEGEGGINKVKRHRVRSWFHFLCLSAGIVFQQQFPPLVGVYLRFLPRGFLGASRMVAVAFNVRYLSKTHVSETASPRPRESGNPSSHSLYVCIYISGHAKCVGDACPLLNCPQELACRRFHSTHSSNLTPLPPKQSRALPIVRSTVPLLSLATLSRS